MNIKSKVYFSELILLTKTYNLDDFKDWLHWHLDIIHVDHIVVFDNESLVDIKSVCVANPKVEYHLVKGWPNQYKIYNEYINDQSKAWWVLPIDDDEFLYIGNKYKHDVNTMLVTLQKKMPEMKKLSIEWLNMFSPDFLERRFKSLIETCTAYSFEACTAIFPMWRQDNRWVKTFCRTTCRYIWAFDKLGKKVNGGHNPCTALKVKLASHMEDGTKILNCSDMVNEQKFNPNCFIAHFQYKSNFEWVEKCTKRVSAANRTFDKNKPLVYKKLYDMKITFKKFLGFLDLWQKK